MAEALIKGLIVTKTCTPENILVSDIRPERLTLLKTEYQVQTLDKNSDLAEKVDVLILGVKPQNMTEALQSIKGTLKADALVISIAAGIKTADIAAVLGDLAIVRVMPNTPALIGAAASALFANDKAKQMLKKAEAILSAVGQTVVVDNEDLIDAVTAVSGSGPAYYFLLTEQMIKAAVELGLSEDVAKTLVLQTAKGAALLAAEADKKGETVAQLRQKVTSPGGTTEAALKVLEDAKFAQLIAEAIKAARDKSQQLSK
ncbi:MAG: pyrroline-5-carboxylate reductase [Planctomycetes bacterium]|nr:pyrroline-5-carboxylate reductase [Planctomycetota bacterium]